MPEVCFCKHCNKIIKREKEDYVVVKTEWQDNPAEYVHFKCEKGYRERTEPRGTMPGPNIDIQPASYRQEDED